MKRVFPLHVLLVLAALAVPALAHAHGLPGAHLQEAAASPRAALDPGVPGAPFAASGPFAASIPFAASGPFSAPPPVVPPARLGTSAPRPSISTGRTASRAAFPRSRRTRGARRAFRGTLVIRHSDRFGRGASTTRYTLRRGGRGVRIVPSAAPSRRIRAGSRVVVRGRRTGSAIRGRIEPAEPLARSAAVLGARKTAVILFNFAGDTSQPWTPAEVRGRFFTNANSTNAFYREQSYNQLELVGRDRADGDVYGWYTIAANNAVCDEDLWAAQARSAVTAAGGSLAGYDNVVYVFPDQASCGWAGLAEMPGNESWINGDLSVRVTAHELGHNFGVHHAASLRCSNGGGSVAISGSCTMNEYGDPFDVMGSAGSRHSNAWHLQQLGYLPAANVRTVSASGTYTIRSAISQDSGVQSLRIPRQRDAYGNVVDYYYLEFRTPGGVFDNFNPADPVVNGVSLRVNREPSVITQSRLLDATPGTSSYLDSALGVGQTFTDGATSVTTTGLSGLTATVAVTVGSADTAAPAAPGGVQAVPTTGGLRVSWTAATDNVGVTGYRVTRDGVSIGTTALTSLTDTNALAGTTYSYRVIAYDAAGNATSSAAVPGTVPPPPDVSAPTAPRGLSATVSDGRTRLTWSPSLDDRGVSGYIVLRDGDQVATTSSTAFEEPAPAPGEERGYQVAAFDAAGNRSSPSATYNVRLPNDADVRAPVISLRRPVDRSRVRGTVPIHARATDDSGVATLELWIDGRRRRVVRSGDLRFSWNTARIARGRHTLRLRAVDAGGNAATRAAAVSVITRRR